MKLSRILNPGGLSHTNLCSIPITYSTQVDVFLLEDDSAGWLRAGTMKDSESTQSSLNTNAVVATQVLFATELAFATKGTYFPKETRTAADAAGSPGK